MFPTETAQTKQPLLGDLRLTRSKKGERLGRISSRALYSFVSEARLQDFAVLLAFLWYGYQSTGLWTEAKVAFLKYSVLITIPGLVFLVCGLH